MVKSPVTGSISKIVDSFSVLEIIKGYKKYIGVEVSGYFKNMQELSLYECPDTKMRFFSPASLAGDGNFYTALEDRSGYYDEWKWDYQNAFPFIQQDCKVLDIGCGRGAFLDKLKKEKNCTVHGLELNPSAFEMLQQRGISAEMQMVETHCIDHKEKYDVVCFFQVLEHIADVKNFLDAAITCLKPGGILILAVPNNEPYLHGFNKYDWLNLPPHHMGWWNSESLNKLADFFPITVEQIKAADFRDFNMYLDEEAINLSISAPHKLVWNKIIRPVKKIWIQVIKDKIPGIFIMAVYRKK